MHPKGRMIDNVRPTRHDTLVLKFYKKYFWLIFEVYTTNNNWAILNEQMTSGRY